MKKEVKLRIKGTRIQVAPYDIEMEPLEGDYNPEPLRDEEEEATELTTTGIYYFKEGMHYVKYDEYFDGLPVPVKNLLKFNESSMEMVKKGPVNVVMSFGYGKWVGVDYNTPEGSIRINVLTKDYAMDMGESGGRVDMRYYMDFGNLYTTVCDLTIDIDG